MTAGAAKMQSFVGLATDERGVTHPATQTVLPAVVRRAPPPSMPTSPASNFVSPVGLRCRQLRARRFRDVHPTRRRIPAVVSRSAESVLAADHRAQPASASRRKPNLAYCVGGIRSARQTTFTSAHRNSAACKGQSVPVVRGVGVSFLRAGGVRVGAWGGRFIPARRCGVSGRRGCACRPDGVSRFANRNATRLLAAK